VHYEKGRLLSEVQILFFVIGVLDIAMGLACIHVCRRDWRLWGRSQRAIMASFAGAIAVSAAFSFIEAYPV